MATDDRDDASLVEHARRGDRRAFGALYERFAPAVHAVLLGYVGPHDARDLVQDVFVQALRALHQLRDSERVGPWLLAIARSRGLNARTRGVDHAALPADVVDTHGGAADALATRQEADAALEALAALPDAYRETLTMRLVEGMSGPEIAARTGKTPGSVRVNLCRGLKLLRERLGGVAPPSTPPARPGDPR